MPVVRRGQNNFIIVSSRRGRYITHQLSESAARELGTKHGEIDGLEISVQELIDLKQRGDAYFNRDRRARRQKKWRETPRPAVAPVQSRHESQTAPAASVKTTSQRAAFCAACGRRSRRPFWRWIVLVALLAAIAGNIALYLAWQEAADLRDRFATRLYDADRELRLWNAQPGSISDTQALWDHWKETYPGVDVFGVWGECVIDVARQMSKDDPRFNSAATNLFHQRAQYRLAELQRGGRR